MRQCLKVKIDNLSLGKKIITIYLCSILIISTIFIAALKIIISLNHQMLQTSIASSLSYSAHEMNGILNSVEDISMQIFADSQMQQNLTAIKQFAALPAARRTKDDLAVNSISQRNIYNLLTNQLNNNPYITYISVILDESSVTSSSYQAQISDDEEFIRHICAAAADELGKSIWITSDTNGLFLVRTIRQIDGLFLTPLGTLIIQLDMEKLVADATVFSNLFEDSHIFLFSGENLLYRPPEFETVAYSPAITSENSYDIIDWNQQKYFTVVRTITSLPLTVACLVPYNQVFYPMVRTYILCFFIIALTIVLVILFALFLIQNINRHFFFLLQKMDAFDGNNQTLPVIDYDYTHRTDELGLIHNHFDRMAVKIDTLITENYLKQIHVKEAQIKALQAQINPHFLYNTLNIINWKAKLAGEYQISNIVEALGTLFRTALRADSGMHSIQAELSLVESYITIQKYRFASRLNYHQFMEPELSDILIPKLTIQPLVENAIKYSVEVNTEASNVYVAITATDDTIIIRVKNDGSQFEDNPYEKKPEGSGIGLVNINMRIQLMFGEDYGLSLFNEEEFAIAQITIPRHDSHEHEC